MFRFKLKKEEKQDITLSRGRIDVSTINHVLSFDLKEEIDLQVKVGLFTKTEIYRHNTLQYMFEKFIETALKQKTMKQGTIVIPTDKILKFELKGATSVYEHKTVYNRVYKRF